MIHHTLGAGTMALGAFLLAATVYHVATDDSRANLTSDTTMVRDFYGCATIDMEERQFHLLISKDSEAWMAYMKPRLDAGVCRDLEKGMRIAVEQRQPSRHKEDLGNWYCARPYADPQCYWAPGGFVFGKDL